MNLSNHFVTAPYAGQDVTVLQLLFDNGLTYLLKHTIQQTFFLVCRKTNNYFVII